MPANHSGLHVAQEIWLFVFASLLGMVCLVCKTLLLFRHRALCPSCLEGLLSLREPVVRDEGRFKVCSLFAWRKNGPRGLPWLIWSLKEKEREVFWREMAVSLLSAFGPLAPAVFVPIPSRRSRNHALGLARALSAQTSWPIQPALGLSPGKRKQKSLSRGERHDLQFERELWDFYNPPATVIIVDDVVTTGATARAAFHTLGRPKSCQVWCLLDRRPCGA